MQFNSGVHSALDNNRIAISKMRKAALKLFIEGTQILRTLGLEVCIFVFENDDEEGKKRVDEKMSICSSVDSYIVQQQHVAKLLMNFNNPDTLYSSLQNGK